MRPSYLYNGNSYTGEMASLYWDGPWSTKLSEPHDRFNNHSQTSWYLTIRNDITEMEMSFWQKFWWYFYFSCHLMNWSHVSNYIVSICIFRQSNNLILIYWWWLWCIFISVSKNDTQITFFQYIKEQGNTQLNRNVNFSTVLAHMVPVINTRVLQAIK